MFSGRSLTGWPYRYEQEESTLGTTDWNGIRGANCRGKGAVGLSMCPG